MYMLILFTSQHYWLANVSHKLKNVRYKVERWEVINKRLYFRRFKDKGLTIKNKI